MEKENPFKLFVPPRLSAGQPSAVRTQGFNKCPGDDFKLPFRTLNRGEVADSATMSQQVKLCSEVDEENIETMNELYSKLYKEAEKIKQWKLTVESELNQKERKLQENRNVIEAQHKTIQELQFENEKLHLKLEDELCEKKDLLKENTASRHLCNLLKETCTHFTEKTSKYEQEREETRQLYEELHSNVERMTVAFEELRGQAENDRLEMSFKLKEEAEKMEKLERDCKLEVSQKEEQISALIIQSDEKDDVIRDIKAQLQESQNKIADLIEEKSKREILKESQVNQEHLRAELEEAKTSLEKAEVTQKSLENEFQTTVKTLIQVTEEKEAQEEECKKTKALHAALTAEFETSIASLKSLLQKEQNRLEKCEDESKLLTLELRNKSAELEEMTKLKCDKEMQLEELSGTLEKIEGLLLKKEHLEATVESLQEREEETKNVLQMREKEIHDLKAQLTSTVEKEQDYLNQLLTLKTDLEQETLKNEQLTVCINKLSLEKEQIAQEKSDVAAELKKLQESHKDSKKKEENTKQLVENLEEANSQLRNELESLKEKMAKTGEEIESKLDEREENMNNLKKQVENKTKCIEELQQENKVLKKKITAESKKTSIYEGKVEKLKLLYDEATMIQRETDIRCQHKIKEMVALMEKHKHEYDKMVEEKDAELKLYKIKQQEQLSSERSLESELSRLKSELSSLKEQLKEEIEEKENLVKKHSQNRVPETEMEHKTYVIKTPPVHTLQGERSTNLPPEQSTRKKQKVLLHLDTHSDSSEHSDLLSMVSEEKMFKKLYQDYPQASQLHSTAPKKTYVIKTPPVHTLQGERSTNLPPEQSTRKKQKVLLHLDTHSDSSEHSDLLSMVSEEKMFKKLYQDYPQASQLYSTAPKKTPTLSSVKSPGSALKLKAMRKMHEAGWAAVSKVDRRRKIKEVAKFFA
ncbi:synaptonemal complex protein 1 isoform X3 [Chiroxiphia lanceolata]|uniref:synaptonemal complex protein 1 isoform X3 n=1 Tax=Chiroxiphia lanceolata TaxID=296741 RepID=UPI0013CEA0EB|nr:synaptonemal complex protein 1 isoform X3 [Chiroxiphia lanceolata]